jgi:hypothetical protein
VLLLWLVAFAAVLGTMIFWFVFPGIYGVAVLPLVLLVGLLLVDRQPRHRAS